MRISDWSSDVCSSDLLLFDGRVDGAALFGDFGEVADAGTGDEDGGTGFLEGGVDAGRPVDAGRHPIPALPSPCRGGFKRQLLEQPADLVGDHSAEYGVGALAGVGRVTGDVVVG